MQKLKKERGITLIALVVTIVVLLILAGITIGLVFGTNGIINKAHEANENTKIEQVREQLELAKGPEYIEGEGKYNPDSYFERIEAEGIIGNKETDVKDNEDGTYEVTTVQGYIFIITLVPSKDNVEDIEIDYEGKVDGPRIREINVTNKTTSSISIEVETANAEGATYRYYYKKEGEEEWKKAGEGKENTYTFNGLEENKVYNIKAEIEKDGKIAAEETSSMTGEMPTGAVQFSPVEWENGKASTVITTSEEGYTLQYQIGGIAEGSWKDTTSGSTIGDLEYGVTVYGRLYDGTNGSKTGSIDVEDKIKPTVVVTEGTITTKSIVVNVEAVDNESGMKGTPTYTYYIKKTGEADSAYEAKATDITEASYTFTGLTQKTGYDIKVEVKEDKAGNAGIGKLLNKETGEIGGATGGLVEGNIIASTPTWSNGKASITLSTSTRLTIQYQVDGIEDNNWTPGTEVTGLQHGQTVYARLTDGINYGDEASVDILDNIAPTVTVTKGEVTTKSIVVSVSSSDEQWGMPSTPTYSYYIKKSTDGSYPTEASYTGTNTSHTFNNLSQTTNYDIQVTVLDKAENVGTGTLLNQTTGTVGGATGGLIEGNIMASTPTWSNGQASITLSTNTGLTIQYQVGGIEDNNWTTGTSVTGLQHGQTVYARLTDGINYGDEASVDIKDNMAPQVAIISLSSTNVTTGTTVNATVTHKDNESGVNITGCKYIWNTSNTKIGTNAGLYTGGTFSINEQKISRTMSSKGIYYLHVLTVDKGGNATETVSNGITVRQLATGISVSPTSVTLEKGETKQLTVTVSPTTVDNKSVTWSSNNTSVVTVSSSGLITAKTAGSAIITVKTADGSNKTATCNITVKNPNLPIGNVLKAGNYVYYNAANPILCMVLYDNSSAYGIQIITIDTVGTAKIGGQTGYNNLIDLLNSKTLTYLNSTYASDIRCVGSVPNNKSSQSVTANYHGATMRKQDDNYLADWNQMGVLGIRKSNTSYYLASRLIREDGYVFCSRMVDNTGNLYIYGNLCIISSGEIQNWTGEYGLRPVITLKPDVKVTGGDGTSSNPYTLGI